MVGTIIQFYGLRNTNPVLRQDPVNGAQRAGSWACRETFVAVVIGNLPMIYPLFRRGMERAAASSYFSRSKANGSGGSYAMEPSSKASMRRKRRSLHALPTTLQDDESFEHIVPSNFGSKDDGIRVTTETAVDYTERTPSTNENKVYDSYTFKAPPGHGYHVHITSDSHISDEA